MSSRELAERLTSLHRKHYGRDPQVISYAPGRVEVLGNHTDYNLGTVLSAAIDKGHCFAISSNEGKGLRLLAGDLEEIASFNLEQISPMEKAPWARYIKGVFYYLKERGLEIKDFDCSFLGSIPVGSGLSSSAALEVSAAFAAQEKCGIWLDPKEIAALCRDAESIFAGCNCGLLDQFSSIFGKKHSLIHSDFKDLSVRSVAIPEDIRFLIVTPEITHSLADSPYNARRESCESAVEVLGTFLSYPVKSLRDVSPKDFEKFKKELPEELAKRAAHIIGEIYRVSVGVDALQRGDIDEFGQLMYLSHESSRDLFENSTPELDLVVEAARESGALGARLSGGGWGGSLIVLARAEEETNLLKTITKNCEKHNLAVKTRVAVPSDGARVLYNSNRENHE